MARVSQSHSRLAGIVREVRRKRPSTNPWIHWRSGFAIRPASIRPEVANVKSTLLRRGLRSGQPAQGLPDRSHQPVSPRPAVSRKRAASRSGLRLVVFSDMVNRNALAASRPGSARIASSIAAVLSPQAADVGFTRSKSIARAPRRSLANPGQCRPAQHSGLAQRPNSGNMDCTGAPIRRFFNSAGARDREPNRRAARVLLVIGLSRFVQKGALPGSTFPGNEGSRPSTLKTYVTAESSVKTASA